MSIDMSDATYLLLCVLLGISAGQWVETTKRGDAARQERLEIRRAVEIQKRCTLPPPHTYEQPDELET